MNKLIRKFIDFGFFIIEQDGMTMFAILLLPFIILIRLYLKITQFLKFEIYYRIKMFQCKKLRLNLKNDN